MTIQQFNAKWADYLDEGHYGMAIDHSDIIEYMDREFQKEIEANPSFTFSQIKVKFGFPRVYANSNNCEKWQIAIGQML